MNASLAQEKAESQAKSVHCHKSKCVWPDSRLEWEDQGKAYCCPPAGKRSGPVGIRPILFELSSTHAVLNGFTKGVASSSCASLANSGRSTTHSARPHVVYSLTVNSQKVAETLVLSNSPTSVWRNILRGRSPTCRCWSTSGGAQVHSDWPTPF